MSRGALYVVGTRSFAAEVVEYAAAAGFDVAGLLEPYDHDRVGTEVHGLPVTWLEDAGPVAAAVGTGERERRPVVERLAAAGIEPVAVVHPAAHISDSARVREGCVVGPAAVVGAATELGRHVVVGRGALVGHHVVVGEFATVNPGANVGGNTTIGSGTLVAIGAVVRDHVRVGNSALVAAGAVVVGDVPDGIEVRGLPARPVERSDTSDGTGTDA
jgi:sugar O-acyltransferase (sialic acid O-acetyltransferase NeuD family)